MDRSDTGIRVDWTGPLDVLLGFDWFISYSREDGSEYALALARMLRQAGFRVFIDTAQMAPGQPLRRALRRASKRSTVTILVGTPGACRSAWVRAELDIAVAAGRPVAPIDIGGALAGLQSDHPLSTLLGDRIRDEEPASARVEGPSAGVFRNVVRAFRFTRRDVWRTRILVGLVVFFLGLSGIAGLSAIRASTARDAEQLARQEAERERDAAVAAREREQLARANAEAAEARALQREGEAKAARDAEVVAREQAEASAIAEAHARQDAERAARAEAAARSDAEAAARAARSRELTIRSSHARSSDRELWLARRAAELDPAAPSLTRLYEAYSGVRRSARVEQGEAAALDEQFYARNPVREHPTSGAIRAVSPDDTRVLVIESPRGHIEEVEGGLRHEIPSTRQNGLLWGIWSPDGQHALVGVWGGPPLLVDRNGVVVGQLEQGSSERIEAVRWSPRSTHLLTRDQQRAQQLWNLRGEQLQEFHYSEDVHWSPDGAHLAAERGATVRILRADGTSVGRVTGEQPLWGWAGRWLATEFHPYLGLDFVGWGEDTYARRSIRIGTESAWTRVWTVDGTLVAELPGSIAGWERGGDRIKNLDEQLRPWIHPVATVVFHYLRPHPSRGWGIHVYEGVGRESVLPAQAPTKQPWRDSLSMALLAAGGLHSQLAHRMGAVLFAAWSTDGNWLATFTEDQVPRIWSANGEFEVALFDQRRFAWERYLYDIEHLPEGRVAAWLDDRRTSVGSDGWSHLWPSVSSPAERGIENISWSRDGAAIYLDAFEGGGIWWEEQAPGGRWRIVNRPEPTVLADGPARDPTSGRTLQILDDVVAVVDEQGALLAELRGHGAPVIAARWSTDGRHILTASSNGKLGSWPAHREDLFRLVDEHLESAVTDEQRDAWTRELALGAAD